MLENKISETGIYPVICCFEHDRCLTLTIWLNIAETEKLKVESPVYHLVERGIQREAFYHIHCQL